MRPQELNYFVRCGRIARRIVEIRKKKTLNTENVLLGSGIGPILANFNCNYRVPIEYPDVIYIKTRISHIGNSSFGIEHELYSKNNKDKIIFEGSSVVVMVNYQDGSKFQLNDKMKKILESFM